MPAPLSRRALLGTGLAAATLPWDLAQAQTPAAGSTLRVGMTANAVPLANGVPDQGAEGHRFMGITLFDQLVQWDLSRADRIAVPKPGLATGWKVDAADPQALDLHPARGRALPRRQALHGGGRGLLLRPPGEARQPGLRPARRGDQRLPPVHRGQLPADGPHTLIIDCKRTDSQLPYLLSWIGITHQGAWEAAGRNWDTFMQRAIGTGPWKMESYSIRERCVMTRNADYWDATRVPRTERLVLLPLSDPNTRVAALRAGQVDFIEAPPPDAIPALRQAGFQITSNVYPHNWMYFLSYVEGSPWRDPRIRRAANLGIDRAGHEADAGRHDERGRRAALCRPPLVRHAAAPPPLRRRGGARADGRGGLHPAQPPAHEGR